MDGVATFDFYFSAYQSLASNDPEAINLATIHAHEVQDASDNSYNLEFIRAVICELGARSLRQSLMTFSQKDAATVLRRQHTSEETERVIWQLTYALQEAEKETDHLDTPLYRIHLIVTLSIVFNHNPAEVPLKPEWDSYVVKMNQLQLGPDEGRLVQLRDKINWRIYLNQPPSP